MKTPLSLIALAALVCLQGCIFATKTTTTRTMDAQGNPVETVVEAPASPLGPSDYSEGYAGAYQEFQRSKANRVESIANSDCPADAAAAAYCGASKLLGAVLVSNERFEMAKPTTGMDVLNSAVGHIPIVSSSAALYRLGEAGINAAGNISFGDNAKVSGSLNKTESRNIGSGSASSTSTSNGTNGEKKDSTSSSSAIDPAHLNECITTTGGARPSADEINGCMIGYGYETTVENGVVMYNGQPL